VHLLATLGVLSRREQPFQYFELQVFKC